MSPDLTRALHDAVDTGPDDSPFDAASLTGRIRRRRNVRRGVRGGVTLGAVGAVAFGATFLRPPASVLPAARPDAAPGSCGSDIGSLPAADASASFGLIPSTDGTWEADDLGVPAVGTDLGDLVGRALTPILVRALPAAERDTAITEQRRAAQKALAEAEERRGEAVTSGLVESEVRALEDTVREARRQLDEADKGMPILSLDYVEDLGTEVLVTHGATVVVTDADPAAVPDEYWWMSPVDHSVAMTMLDTDLSTCASPGDPGGVALPAGEYSVYVSYEEGGERTLAGPWPLTLLTEPPIGRAELPADFPVDAVPLIGGRLLSVNPIGATSGDGWVVEIGADGDDAEREAIRLLVGDRYAQTVGPAPEGTYLVSGWEVRVARSETATGEPSVVYTVRRADPALTR